MGREGIQEFNRLVMSWQRAGEPRAIGQLVNWGEMVNRSQRAEGRKRRTPGCHRGDTLSPLASCRVETHSPTAQGPAVETLDFSGDAGSGGGGASSGTADALSST
jgi:hypothetical protein